MVREHKPDESRSPASTALRTIRHMRTCRMTSRSPGPAFSDGRRRKGIAFELGPCCKTRQ
jgi:hypothetical protein